MQSAKASKRDTNA